MQEKFHKQLFLPAALLAIVGITGAVYVIPHTEPVHAQAESITVTKSIPDTDKETRDDTISSSPKQTHVSDGSDKEQSDTSGGNEREDNN